MYDFCVADDPPIRAWRPEVPGVAEVLHAHMTSHVYPMHTHQTWTLLIVDDGMIRYDLHRHEHGALHQAVTLLPPQVPQAAGHQPGPVHGRQAVFHAMRGSRTLMRAARWTQASDQTAAVNGTVTVMASGNQCAPACPGAPQAVCRYRIGAPKPPRVSPAGNP